jgi:hypothetical protein
MLYQPSTGSVIRHTYCLPEIRPRTKRVVDALPPGVRTWPGGHAESRDSVAVRAFRRPGRSARRSMIGQPVLGSVERARRSHRSACRLSRSLVRTCPGRARWPEMRSRRRILGGTAGIGRAAMLLERERELESLWAVVEAAGERRGSVGLIEGDAGIGKTGLLDRAAALACAGGVAVLGARGTPLEREFGFGIVRQLFERKLAAADERGCSALLAGAAEAGVPRASTVHLRSARSRPGSDPDGGTRAPRERSSRRRSTLWSMPGRRDRCAGRRTRRVNRTCEVRFRCPCRCPGSLRPLPARRGDAIR